MLQLTVNGVQTDTPRQIDFRLADENGDVNVYANNDLIGWFEINHEGKIEFCPTTPNDCTAFATDDEGFLAIA